MEQIFVDKMTDGTRDLGITLSEQQLEQFYRYYKLLVEWNKVMNLSRNYRVGGSGEQAFYRQSGSG